MTNNQKYVIKINLHLYLPFALFLILCMFVSDKLCATENSTNNQTDVKDISVNQARELIGKQQDVFLLDIRTKEEHKEVHIKDAHLIPVQELEQNIDKIPKDRKVIVYCGSGMRNSKACKILKEKGYKELYNVEGGIKKWRAEGYPVEKH
jgi:rhodanese-related sulfurtransferase